MQTTEDMSPISPNEREFLAIDFSDYLAAGDSLNNIISWTCTVADRSLVIDTTPSARLDGNVTANGNIAVQAVKDCIAGVTYVMTAIVQTAQGEKLELWSFIECKEKGIGY